MVEGLNLNLDAESLRALVHETMFAAGNVPGTPILTKTSLDSYPLDLPS